jgi:predicted AlkP superfamily phosphohydrolase/phosphomutase
MLPAYIGPGAGFAFLGSFASLLLSIAAGFLSLALWPARTLLAFVRGGFAFRRARVKKLIFLGLDGFDPAIAERLMSEGKLPNLARLKEQGGYRRLRTTYPPLSPVAWSTFATGVNPGRHNIFDFLSRDLRTYVPELSSAKIRAGSIEMRRKSEPFWKILSRHAIRSTILRVPITFPPDHFSGHMLSAMATPDLRGTQGDFTLYTADDERADLKNRRPLKRTETGYAGEIEGPPGELLPFRITENRLIVNETAYGLPAGKYTPWIRLRFASARGLAKFRLATGEPPALYVTPIQIDPENPAMPISHPRYFAMYLSKLLGAYATAGMAEDTTALNEGAIDAEAFLEQAKSIQREREAMFFSSLDRLKRGAVACVFDTTDRVQHMFYRQYENRPNQCDSEGGVIEHLYRDMDRVVGLTMKYADQATALFILSDHGFCSFRRGVNLNSWLLREGYLALVGDAKESGEYFEGVDWKRTRAYTFGLGGLYINQRGREAHGIVEPGDAPALMEELRTKLAGLRDEKSGVTAIRNVYPASEIYDGPYKSAAPDLVIGYAAGYRASWDAAVGKATRDVFTDNNKAWSGDHCVDPALVPGVLFSNLKISAREPGIEDMAPTALDLFGIRPPGWMEGKTVCG